MQTGCWSEPEREIIRKGFEVGLSDIAVAKQLQALGYKRTKHGVGKQRWRMGLHKPHAPGSGRPRQEEDVAPTQYWSKQKRADEMFQRALYAAGCKAFVDTAPCTEKPMLVRAEPVLHSAGNFVYPAEVPK